MQRADELKIDGRQGEGGGQVVRTSLSLAAALGRSVTIENVRGGRQKPGLLRQHRTALRAVRDITAGEIEGDELGSTTVRFRPGGAPNGGKYHFGIGSAGSTMLVLQTVIPPLMLADEPSTVTLDGGTHNPSAPPFEVFDESFLPCVRAMGGDVAAQLMRRGFYPAGGGELRVDVTPTVEARPFELTERGSDVNSSCEVIVQNLSDSVAEQEWKAFQKRSHWKRHVLKVTNVERGRGPGNVMLARLRSQNVNTVIASFGMRTVSSKLVGTQLASAVKRYLASDAPVDEHLADQLMLPLALLGGGTFRCGAVTMHARTNADVINLFLPGAVSIEMEEGAGDVDSNGSLVGPARITVAAR